jgi:Na+/H+ antiporter NhaD/arsenite permease-like protein
MVSPSKVLSKIFNHIGEEWIFYLSLGAAVVASLYAGRFPKIEPPEWRVLFLLYLFMVVTNSLHRTGILNWIARRLERGRWINLQLVFLTGILSMFVTNDIALMVTVPLTLSLGGEGVERVVILETLAANAFSALSPIGNPQNIYIYHAYELNLETFIKAIAPLGLFLIPALALLSLGRKAASAEREVSLNLTGKTLAVIFNFFLFVAVALKILPPYWGLLPLIFALLWDRQSLRVDFFLLGTFLSFFAFTDAVSHLLKLRLSGKSEIFFSSVFLSQIVGNVPATLILAEFSADWKPLLWGASVGGFGVLWASMANVIAYRLYRQRFGPRGGKFLLKFHAYSFAFLLLGILAFLLSG